jgi:diketogulonate reductase-like aldo/keto reductase
MAALDGGDMTDRSLQTRIKLNNGVQIPILGLGVFQAPIGDETQQAVLWALEAGYRHIDTAAIYANEADVGEAIKTSGIPREQIFVTTKLWNSEHGAKHARHAISSSLTRLGLDYVDLYLIHWPVQGLRTETWKALEGFVAEGKCRAIGVSNYMVHHLEELLSRSQVVPAVNQIEVSPFNYKKDLIRFCADKGIVVEAYSPLTQGQRFDHPAIVAAAAKYKRSPAQILIRWALQHDLVVLPKSVKKERIGENAAVFDFSIAPEDMEILDGLHEGLHTGWDPTDAR